MDPGPRHGLLHVAVDRPVRGPRLVGPVDVKDHPARIVLMHNVG